MTELPPKLLDDIVNRLVDAIHPRAIYLFGSHSPRHIKPPHEHSDIDLLLIVDDELPDLQDVLKRASLALWGIMWPVDLLVWRQRDADKTAANPRTIVSEAFHQGVRLYAA